MRLIENLKCSIPGCVCGGKAIVGNKECGKIKVSYPRYKREQDLRCKLMDKDIDFIRTHYQEGDLEYGQRALSRMFNVSRSAIRRWVDEDYRIKSVARRTEQLRLFGNKRNFKEDTKKFLLRKRTVLSKEMKTFETLRHRIFAEKHPGYGAERMRKYRSNKCI